MEPVSTTIGTAKMLIDAAPYIIGAVGTIYAAVQQFRQRKFRAALDLSNASLNTVIAAVEVYGSKPGNEAKAKEIKETIQRFAVASGVERDKLADSVEKMVASLQAAGILSDPNVAAREERAAKAIVMAREARANRAARAARAGVAGAIMVGLASTGLVGCCAPKAPPRLTAETVSKTEIVVEWPTCVPNDPDAFQTFCIDGRWQTVVPIDGEPVPVQ